MRRLHRRDVHRHREDLGRRQRRRAEVHPHRLAALAAHPDLRPVVAVLRQRRIHLPPDLLVLRVVPIEDPRRCALQLAGPVAEDAFQRAIAPGDGPVLDLGHGHQVAVEHRRLLALQAPRLGDVAPRREHVELATDLGDAELQFDVDHLAVVPAMLHVHALPVSRLDLRQPGIDRGLVLVDVPAADMAPHQRGAGGLEHLREGVAHLHQPPSPVDDVDPIRRDPHQRLDALALLGQRRHGLLLAAVGAPHMPGGERHQQPGQRRQGRHRPGLFPPGLEEALVVHAGINDEGPVVERPIGAGAVAAVDAHRGDHAALARIRRQHLAHPRRDLRIPDLALHRTARRDARDQPQVVAAQRHRVQRRQFVALEEVAEVVDADAHVEDAREAAPHDQRPHERHHPVARHPRDQRTGHQRLGLGQRARLEEVVAVMDARRRAGGQARAPADLAAGVGGAEGLDAAQQAEARMQHLVEHRVVGAAGRGHQPFELGAGGAQHRVHAADLGLDVELRDGGQAFGDIARLRRVGAMGRVQHMPDQRREHERDGQVGADEPGRHATPAFGGTVDKELRIGQRHGLRSIGSGAPGVGCGPCPGWSPCEVAGPVAGLRASLLSPGPVTRCP